METIKDPKQGVVLDGKKHAIVTFNLPIEPNSTQALINVCSTLVGSGHDDIHLLLNSSGGSVQDGFGAYNYLKSVPAKVSTYNIGNVDSIAGIVFQAGARRVCFPMASFLMHGVGGEFQGRVDAQVMEDRLQAIRLDEERIASIYEQHTKLDASVLATKFRQQTVYSASDALAVGLVDDVFVAQFPRGITQAQLEVKRG